jgi:hypothetical protein
MQPIGFSTGAIALGDFNRALVELSGHGLAAVELSALREHELAPLMAALPTLSLNSYEYVSVHAPSKLNNLSDVDVVQLLQPAINRLYPIIVHPDGLRDVTAWRSLRSGLCIENMDGRKPIGRTVPELNRIFDALPEATFCFDIGHAYQIDPTMKLAGELLHAFDRRLRQVHLSYVTPDFFHHRITKEVASDYSKVAALIPAHVPVILESPVSGDAISAEIAFVADVLPPRQRIVA